MLTIGTALATLGGCAAVRRYLNQTGRRERTFFRGQVRLTGLWNTGAAFNLPIPARTLWAASAGALALVWAQRRRAPAGAGLMLGGGLSNLWERLWQGGVYDYVQFPRSPKPLNRYVFNLADFAILAGGLICAGRRSGAGHSRR